jgi:hypothetical protein
MGHGLEERSFAVLAIELAAVSRYGDGPIPAASPVHHEHAGNVNGEEITVKLAGDTPGLLQERFQAGTTRYGSSAPYLKISISNLCRAGSFVIHEYLFCTVSQGTVLKRNFRFP